MKPATLTGRDGRDHVARDGVVIGREDDCEIVLDDHEVSRRHAAIRSVGDGLGIEDLGSRNGTSVNGKPTDGVCALADGDEIRIGDSVLRLSAKVGDNRGGADQGKRGDVPEPEIVPSVVRRAPDLGQIGKPKFTAAAPKRIRGSAARRVEATVISYAVVLLTAVAVVLYLVSR